MTQSMQTPRGTVVIRAANQADAMQFRELRLEALQDSPTAFSADYQMNVNQPMSYWEGRLSEDDHAITFLAEHEHHLIGLTGIARGRSVKTQHGAGIWGVYVQPAWRGLHIAEALLEACIHWANAREVNIVRLAVVSTNESAIQCYKRCGFTVYGIEPRALYFEGQYYDEFLMCRSTNSTKEK